MKKKRRLSIRRGHVPTIESAIRAFRNEELAYCGKTKRAKTRGHNPGGFDSADIHPMDTGKFRNPQLIDEKNRIELWKTDRSYYAVGMINNHQWWAVPIGDIR